METEKQKRDHSENQKSTILSDANCENEDEPLKVLKKYLSSQK